MPRYAKHLVIADRLARIGEDGGDGPAAIANLGAVFVGIGPAMTYGVVYKDRRYVAGRSVSQSDVISMTEVPWFNELFEIADPIRKKRKSGSQAHSPR